MPAIPDNYAAGDKTRGQPPGCLEQNSSGMVLVVVVILAAVAGVLAAGLHFASGSRITQVRQEMRFEKAFFVAEAGIERAKSELLDCATNLNGVLTNGGVLFGGFTNYGEGGFYVWVRNNTNSDPNPFVDTDHIVIIRSTGIVETATRVIEAEVTVMPTLAYTSMPTQADSAFSIYGTNTDLIVKGDSKIDGNDWNLPSTLGNNDETPSGNPTNPGVLYSSPSTTIDTNKADSIVGNPPTTNGAGVYDEAYWLQFTDTMMSSAILYAGGSLGTRAAPIITMLPSGVTMLNGTVSGVGILIVPGDATLKVNGTFDYEGLVIVVGDGIVDLSDEVTALGTAKIFGAMICVGGSLDIKATGTFDLKYSTEALANLAFIVNKPTFPAYTDSRSWREIK